MFCEPIGELRQSFFWTPPHHCTLFVDTAAVNRTVILGVASCYITVGLSFDYFTLLFSSFPMVVERVKLDDALIGLAYALVDSFLDPKERRCVCVIACDMYKYMDPKNTKKSRKPKVSLLPSSKLGAVLTPCFALLSLAVVASTPLLAISTAAASQVNHLLRVLPSFNHHGYCHFHWLTQ